MTERERYRPAACPAEPLPAPHRARAADLYPRARTHYDEPGINVGFLPICGESVQWVGRTADGSTIAVSNYRLHVQPRKRNGTGASVPLRIIDAVEIRDLLHLIVLCKHGRQFKCTFTTGDQCLEWWRRLNTSALAPINSVQETFAAAYAAWAKEQPPTSVHRALMRASHSATRPWFGSEVERLGFTTKGVWRVTAANADYKLCPSYPPLLIVPASIGDEDLDSVARFRAMRRIPAVVWRHRGNGAVLARSSQPEVGWLGWRSAEDERLLAAFVAACSADRANNKNQKLLIVDARSYASAVTNRARGGGCECQQYYPNADIQFMCLPNIHHVRRSFQQLRALTAEPGDQTNWLCSLERTLWLQYTGGVIRAAGVTARALAAGRPALVHCSDGWDRTPQILAAAQLQLDTHYRTRAGFRTLIEREWLDFGHKFADRCGHQFGPEDPNERSPIFIQWLDVVHQMMLQYPCSFEFNEAYLLKLATHVHSCMFGTFLRNTARERVECRANELAQVWGLLSANHYRNHLYSPQQAEVLWPEYGLRSMQFWSGLFCGEREEPDEELPETSARSPRQHTNGLMSKTRSCDNLLNETEKITTQRRSSDPNIAPDVMKLSSMMAGDVVEGRERGLTDSCLDDLPLLPAPSHNSHDQVDGLHPDHFETSRLPRDIASESSSLERELTADKHIEHNSETETERSDMSDHMVESVVENMVNNVVENGVDLAESVIRVEETHEEPSVYVCDTYNDVIGMAETARETARMRNVSITWRSVSESSNQSSAAIDILDIPIPPLNRIEPQPIASDNSRSNSHESSPLDNHNSTEGDVVNHNIEANGIINHQENGVINGSVNGLHEVTAKFLEVELNGGGTSSSVSSSSSGELRRRRRTHARSSLLTLCPTSPGHPVAVACAAGCGCGCGCGAEPADGLPPALDHTQNRLHQIIQHQKKVVEELCGQLREARQALRLMSPPPAAPSLPEPHQRSGTTGSGTGSLSGSTSGSSSASDVEVGEEARGVVWLPDRAAPRCQHCRTSFWLARRRHHCRRCGGIFCASCSEMSAWGSMGTVRMCTRCRTR